MRGPWKDQGRDDDKKPGWSANAMRKAPAVPPGIAKPKAPGSSIPDLKKKTPVDARREALIRRASGKPGQASSRGGR